MSDGRERGSSGSAQPPPAIVEPRPASTVILLREANGLEVFLVQRHGSMGFMGGMYVFPGGKTAPGDSSARMLDRIVAGTRDAHQARWGDTLDPEAAIARAVGGIRETFEEAGVLLGLPQSVGEFDAMRSRLHAGEDFAALLEAAALRLDLAALEPYARWITPEREPVRFDTTFYLARAPADQVARHDEQESVAGAWFTPAAALEAAAEQRIRLAPPTERTIEWLRDFDAVPEAFAKARSRRPPTILPIIRPIENELTLLMPGDAEHPVREPAFPGPTRRVLRRP